MTLTTTVYYEILTLIQPYNTLINHLRSNLFTIISASSPPFTIKASFNSWIRYTDAKSYFFFINPNINGRCLLRAGPKLLEALLKNCKYLV